MRFERNRDGGDGADVEACEGTTMQLTGEFGPIRTWTCRCGYKTQTDVMKDPALRPVCRRKVSA